MRKSLHSFITMWICVTEFGHTILKLDFYHNFLAVKLKFDENGMYMQHLDGKKIEVKLSEKEEVDLKKQIFELGFFSNLQYYMIHSYKANRIE